MKRRTTRTRSRAEWKRNLAGMTEAQKEAFNEHRRRTSKSGYAKRQRERDNGAPMASRTGESPSRWASLVTRDQRAGYAALGRTSFHAVA